MFEGSIASVVNYWIFITTSDNCKVTKEKGVLGVAPRYRNAISKVHIGDKCLVYVKREYRKTKEPSVSGIYEVTSEVYANDSKIFNPASLNRDELFPLRLNVKCLTPSTEPVAFKPLIPRLSFIKNKKYWGGTLQGNALLKIPEQDFMFIATSLSSK